MSFGAYPDIGLNEARKRRDAARSDLAHGLNPSALKQAGKTKALMEAKNTFAAIAEQYLNKKKKENRAAATISKVEWILGIANADFGHMPLNEITAPIVLKTLKKREKLEQYATAKRMRSVIGGVFRYGMARGLINSDPTIALRDALIQPKTTHRPAITDRATLQRFLKALESYHGQPKTRLGLKLLTLFATRPGELRLSRWSEFDIEKRVWNVPAERMKMRKPHAVPLSDLALETLAELREHTGWGDLLFPGQSAANKPISENTFNQALRRMGFGPDEATSHGFRATFSTFANESGLWNPDAIEAYCARQDSNEVRRAYNRSAYWEERVRMADWWAKELQVLCESSNLN